MQRYPLTWPEGWKRTKDGARMEARFHSTTQKKANYGDHYYREKTELTISVAVGRVLNELRTFGVLEGDSIISTNLVLRLDGLPRSDQRDPADPGVAVYWTRPDDKTTKVMAIDLYDRVADNLAAVAATLSAMRAIERHGGAQILERAFTGFTALPEPRDWRKVLEVSERASLGDAKDKFRVLAKKAHPDLGGSHNAMAELNWAIEMAEKELSK